MSDINPYSERAKRWLVKPIKQVPVEVFMLKHPEVDAEYKYDGWCVYGWSEEGKLALVTPHNGIYTKADFPEIFSDLVVTHNTIFQAELVKKTNTLHIHDILWLSGLDVRKLPQHTRKLKLSAAIARAGEHVQFVPSHITKDPKEVYRLYDQALKEGYEGLVIKDTQAPYGMKGAQMKMKPFDPIDVFVTGTYLTKQSNTGYHIAVYSGNQVRDLGDVYSHMSKVDTREIKVGSVLKVSYQPTEGFEHLRHPVIEEVRYDKTKEECTIDQLNN